MKPLNTRGQVTIEAAILWTFVIAAFVFLGVYVQRAAQGGLKSNADSLGGQFSGVTGFSTYSKSITNETVKNTNQQSCSQFQQQVQDVGVAGAPPVPSNCTPTAP